MFTELGAVSWVICPSFLGLHLSGFAERTEAGSPPTRRGAGRAASMPSVDPVPAEQ